MSHSDALSIRQGLRYGMMGLPLAFVALPLYVVLPNHYAKTFGVSMAALGGVLLFARLLDAFFDPLLGRWSDALYQRGASTLLKRAAVACALLGVEAGELAGAGTGLDPAGVARKVAVVQRSLARHRDVGNAGDAAAAIEYLRRLGGFEIAALTGAFVAAAQAGVPVLVDGFITTAAALAAVRINPGVREWLLFGHRSHERGHARLLEALEARPLLDLGLRLGEASGAAMAVPLLRLACALHNQMATFAQAGVSAP